MNTKIHEILKAGGLRKIATGLYMFTVLSGLLAGKCFTGEEFVGLSKVLILAIFAGNTAEHFAPKDTSSKPEETATGA